MDGNNRAVILLDLLLLYCHCGDERNVEVFLDGQLEPLIWFMFVRLKKSTFFERACQLPKAIQLTIGMSQWKVLHCSGLMHGLSRFDKNSRAS